MFVSKTSYVYKKLAFSQQKIAFWPFYGELKMKMAILSNLFYVVIY